MDSNHRRLRQLSYSQPHLATLVTALVLKNSLFLRVQMYAFFLLTAKFLTLKMRIINEIFF